MNSFEDFQLSGVMQKIDKEEKIIITDYYGNLEGWSAKINEIINLNELSGSDCQLFNIMPLIPAFIKYMDTHGVCADTLLFKPCSLKNQSLILMDPKT